MYNCEGLGVNSILRYHATGSTHARNIRLNLCKLYDGPIRLLADDFTVRCIQVESITRGHWMVPLICVPMPMHTLSGIEESLQRSEPECTRNSPPLSDHSIRSRSAELPDKNYKAIVQEYCQKNYLPLPEYAMEYSRGFVSVVTVCGNEYRSKPMGTKKKAEQNAAGMAALDMGLVTISESEGRGARGQANSSVNGASGLGLSSRSASAGFVPPASSLGSIRSQRTAAVPESELYDGVYIIMCL